MSLAQATTVISTDKHLEDVVVYNIRRHMRLAGLTQGDLAALWGVTRGAVSQRLNGYSHLKFTEVAQAAEALNLPITDLMDETAYKQDEELCKYMGYTNTKKAPVDTRPRLDGVGPVGLEPTTGGLYLLITHSAPPSISAVFLRPRRCEGFIVGFHNVALCPQNNMQRPNGAKKSTSISPIYVPPGSVRQASRHAHANS